MKKKKTTEELDIKNENINEQADVKNETIECLNKIAIELVRLAEIAQRVEDRLDNISKKFRTGGF